MTVECDDMEREILSPTANSPVVEDQGQFSEEHTPTRRLVIKEMVLENFKSYAGAQRVGPFHKVRWWLIYDHVFCSHPFSLGKRCL